jgi:D-alanyl-D-alanine carboxypeptidase
MTIPTPCRILIALLALSFVSFARADFDEPVKPPRRYDLTDIDAYLSYLVRDKGYIGMSVAIARDGKIVFAKSYGKACLDPERPVTEDTAFAIGSITKQFTCACILLLADDGKLSVRDPVSKYYPNLTRAKDITLYDLMTHASGYPDYYPLDFVDRRFQKPIACDKLLDEYAGGKLDFEPGSRWSYSNTGYILLGRVVEKVSGESFGSFLEKRILKPLKMEHTWFEPGPGVKNLAQGYNAFALGPPQPAQAESAGWIFTAGALYASASDLARWDIALADGQILKPESFRLMITPRELTTGKVSGYGCGHTIQIRNGDTVLRHSGAVSGFLAANAIIPRTRSAVVVLTNAEQQSPAPVSDLLLTLLIDDQATREAPSVPKVKGASAKDAALGFLHQMQEGKLDRDQLGEEFSIFLTDERVKAAAARLKPLGEPERVEVRGVYERGGMEVSQMRFVFPDNTVLTGVLYRSTDGKIQQLLFNKD